MRYHDYHLQSYEVSAQGKTITLNLVYHYEGQNPDKSQIIFFDVALHHFIHTNGAIIAHIDEITPSKLINEISSQVTEWNRLYGVRGWKNDSKEYASMLDSLGYKAWQIESAVGFFGFVIAKAINNA